MKHVHLQNETFSKNMKYQELLDLDSWSEMFSTAL